MVMVLESGQKCLENSLFLGVLRLIFVKLVDAYFSLFWCLSAPPKTKGFVAVQHNIKDAISCLVGENKTNKQQKQNLRGNYGC